MKDKNYLQWLADYTPTKWWHDSADLDELREGIENNAVGATINPILITASVKKNRKIWEGVLKTFPAEFSGEQRAELLTKLATQQVAEKLSDEYVRSEGQTGYVCAQVNPDLISDRNGMIEMAERFNTWASNIAVKLPATAAGLDALEECIAKGMTIVCTVSFSVPQVLAIAKRYQNGLERAQKNNIKPGKCFAVIMIGRIDDYLRDVVHDSQLNISESDIRYAGIAIAKRAYAIFKERGYSTQLMVAALRGTYHATELAGADIVLSIHPKYQQLLLTQENEKAEKINVPVSEEVISRLQTIPEFVKAYEPDGMRPEEFITYGVVQKTLSQFQHTGWLALQSLCQ